VRFGFGFADLTDVNKLLHKRLIFGRQPDLVFPNDVTAAVADLNKV
jgi:hypothetical protein